MLDQNQLKTEGVNYARSLQMLFKTVAMFSADHQAAQPHFHRSFDLLNAILKQTDQFTIGFVDNRVLIDKLMTWEDSLKPLQAEFLKRGIGAVTFEAGLTMAGYKRAVALISRSPKTIEDQGGLAVLVQQNPVASVRILPAAKEQVKKSDTMLQTDTESFLMAKATGAIDTGNPVDSFESLLRASHAAAGDGEGRGGGEGPGGGGPPETGGPGQITRMVETYFDATVGETADSVPKSYVELARAIREMRPEFILSSLNPERREQLRSLPAEQVAAEILEDQAVSWSGRRLGSAKNDSERGILEEEVVRVLVRTLQVTQTAERLARKLAQFVKDIALPKSSFDRIQEELRWVAVPPSTKTQKLLATKRFDRITFRRLLDHLRELIKAGDFETATALALHSLSFLSAEEPQVEEFSRIPELLRLMGGVRTRFWEQAGTMLADALRNDKLPEFAHSQVANATVTLANTVAVYEDFHLIYNAGMAMEKLAASPAHEACCGARLGRLFPATASDRVLEIYAQRREDAVFQRTASALLRWSGENGISKVFQLLDNETSAPGRLALIRLIGRIGPASLAIARQRLRDERWYVVRNACKLLGELKDPELFDDMRIALSHPEERVQQTAVAAVLESRKAGRGAVLAEALPKLTPHVQETVLGEIAYLKDPAIVAPLVGFLDGEARGKPQILPALIQALGTTRDDSAARSLARVLGDATLDLALRRLALGALKRSGTAEARQLLSEFAARAAGDPLASECLQAAAAVK